MYRTVCCYLKMHFKPNPWCFPHYNQVFPVPKPNHSKSTALWQGRKIKIWTKTNEKLQLEFIYPVDCPSLCLNVKVWVFAEVFWRRRVCICQCESGPIICGTKLMASVIFFHLFKALGFVENTVRAAICAWMDNQPAHNLLSSPTILSELYFYFFTQGSLFLRHKGKKDIIKVGVEGGRRNAGGSTATTAGL